MPKPVSIYFHDERSYDCPECKVSMNRVAVHGWFWGCPKCQKTYPLYILDPKATVEKPEKEGFLSSMRKRFLGGDNA